MRLKGVKSSHPTFHQSCTINREVIELGDQISSYVGDNSQDASLNIVWG